MYLPKILIFLLLVSGLLIQVNHNHITYALAVENPFITSNSTVSDIKIQSPSTFKPITVSPEDGQLDVKLSKKILVTFNTALNSSVIGVNLSNNFIIIKGEANISNSTINLESNKIVKGKYTLGDDNDTISFTPQRDLKPDTRYTVVLFGKDRCMSESESDLRTNDFNPVLPFSSNIAVNISNDHSYKCGISDSEGNVLEQNYVWSFNTTLSSPIISKPHNNSTISTKTFTISGTDPNDASDIKVYRLSDDHKKAKVKVIGSDTHSVNGIWSVKVHMGHLQDGTYQFVAIASKGNSNSRESDYLQLTIDATPPTVNVPGNIHIYSSPSEGVPVTFESNSTDNIDGHIKSTCTPLESGDIFPIGNTKVTCIAKDKAENEGAASFRVNVSSPTPIILTCNPPKLVINQGSEASLNCMVENKIDKALLLNLACSGLGQVGINCYINKSPNIATIGINEKSSEDFDVLVSAKSMKKTSPGQYPFTISAHCQNNFC